MSLLMRNGKFLRQYGKFLRASAASYAEFLRCCCEEIINCCNILAFYAVLEVSGDIEGEIAGGPALWIDNGLSVPLKGFTLENFEFHCVNGVGGGSGIFRVVATIGNSSGTCDSIVLDETFTQQAPCCPMERTFTMPIPAGCDPSEVLTFTIRTPADPPCPEE